MTNPRKIVLHSLRGYRPELEAMVKQWIQEGIRYVGVVGADAARIEDAIDDGSDSYFMLTAAHGSDETLEDAILIAELLSDELAGPATVVEF